ncbi:TPA: DUF3223 domain-containing protein [Proteus mirabilis]|uniref:DUF3223 domain-containing protein n=1 Tax=Proteus mirabilis TaxID=584 RepID=UPI0006666AF4|nr:DUF3223 domain-containing protein [Proteus mirabilis]ELA7680538.1 DUF3223 domain-containing protein [Proteus mirabilis]ELB1713076.1 DUF3223 domain-containing protein [Proteus mirabilis]MBB6650932.1 DUF3223 domain-containing protein [Proteus mirabilis]MBI6205366.1 DUF3223 domain-containing protein [Proteus mirabilis]MBI6372036.1 DUF3223 domain-containing protein [Proteus mirabilis]
MAKPVELDNGTFFKTQSEAKKYFKSILNSSNSDMTIASYDEEFSNILALYKRHPEFHCKTEDISQIKEFIVKDSGQFHTRCFHVIHHDGSIADWSYLSALSTQLKSQFECFIDGARALLESSSYRFRDESFKNKCTDFIISRGFTVGNFPSEWVSEPGKLQYRSSLTICISKDFVNWYKQND